jgi:hypothetical protein
MSAEPGTGALGPGTPPPSLTNLHTTDLLAQSTILQGSANSQVFDTIEGIAVPTNIPTPFFSYHMEKSIVNA